MMGQVDHLTWGWPFALFAHVTQFFGLKVVLLGCHRVPASAADSLVHQRVDPGISFVKLRLCPHTGRLLGAVLIGDTDLDETCENLLLSRLDLSGVDLLADGADLEDFFD